MLDQRHSPTVIENIELIHARHPEQPPDQPILPTSTPTTPTSPPAVLMDKIRVVLSALTIAFACLALVVLALHVGK